MKTWTTSPPGPPSTSFAARSQAETPDDCQPADILDVYGVLATLTEQGHDVEQMDPEDWADTR